MSGTVLGSGVKRITIVHISDILAICQTPFWTYNMKVNPLIPTTPEVHIPILEVSK